MPSDFAAGEQAVLAGHALIKIEHEGMVKVAIERKRDEDRCLLNAKKSLERVPELAAKVYYSIPYKNHRSGCSNRRTCDCPKVFVEGLSIGGARILMDCWRNCASRVVEMEETEDRIQLEGRFIDFESNIMRARPFSVSKFAYRNGRLVQLADRDLIQALQIGVSKAERNAILDGVPVWLRESFFASARKIVADKARKGLDKMISAFAEVGVSRAVLERHFGKPIGKLEDEELAHLRGMYQAIRDSERAVEDLFPESFEEKVEAPSAEDAIKAGAVDKGEQKSCEYPVNDETGETCGKVATGSIEVAGSPMPVCDTHAKA